MASNDVRSISVPAILRGLNQPQLRAVTHGSAPLLVVAGAGTGKTRVVVHRLAYLIASGMDPSGLMAVTFTNRAAGEIRNRVGELAGEGANRIGVGTFHWLGHRILRRHGAHLEVGNRFTLISPGQSGRLIRTIAAHETSPVDVLPIDVRARISRVRNGGSSVSSRGDAAAEHLAGLYVAEMRRRGWLDLDDLVLEAAALLTREASLRSSIQARIGHVLVDEYQDSNPPQVEFLRQLVGPAGSATAVGDDDQAIYGWRYASSGNMARFTSDFPGAEIIRLEYNYRSTQRLLTAANELLRHNSGRLGKTLVSTRQAGFKPQIFFANDETDEAAFVVSCIHNFVDGGLDGRRIAVLYRMNSQSRPLEEALVRAHIPYQIRAGKRFYERREIARMVDALNVIVRPDDIEAIARLLQHARGFGAVRANSAARQIAAPQMTGHGASAPSLSRRLIDYVTGISRQDPLSEIVKAVQDGLNQILGEVAADGSDSESVDANLSEFLAMAFQFENETREPELLLAFLDRLQLAAEPPAEGGDSPGCVQLLTLHAAKGLEFDSVFIVGLEEGILPHRRALLRQEDVEEERRLLYVGMTRARDSLFLTHARTRMFGGTQGATGRSRFVAEIPHSLLRHVTSESRPPQERLAATSLGEEVEHRRWGRGTVTKIVGEGTNAMVSIAFTSGTNRTVQLKHAPLKRIC